MLKEEDIEEIVRRALDEDRAENDVTTQLLIDSKIRGLAVIVSKGDGVISGHMCARKAFELMDNGVSYREIVGDGESVKSGDTIAEIEGFLSAILSAERTALNFLQHLSGIATLTRKFVDIASKRNVRILDTRKTVPGLRFLEKQAVIHGGGLNHRKDLSELILVKENHIFACGGFKAMLSRLGKSVSGAEVEVRSVEELRELAATPPMRVMLDNFSPSEIKEALELIATWKRKPEIEVSGGIGETNIKEYLIDGVDFISIGAITSSAGTLDMSLLVKSVDNSEG